MEKSIEKETTNQTIELSCLKEPEIPEYANILSYFYRELLKDMANYSNLKVTSRPLFHDENNNVVECFTESVPLYSSTDNKSVIGLIPFPWRNEDATYYFYDVSVGKTIKNGYDGSEESYYLQMRYGYSQ
jgi:hypothetical protein